MNIVAYSLLLVVLGWLARGIAGGAWRKVRNRHRLGDTDHFWTEIDGRQHAFTDDQLAVAAQRAEILEDPPRRLRRIAFWTVLIAILTVWMLGLVGCASVQNGRSSRLLPWNWFAPDRASQLSDAEADTAKVEAQMVHAAQVEFSKLVIALELAEASEPVLLARRFAGNGLALLNQVTPLPAQVQVDARSLVQDLLSGDAGRVAAAERTQARDEKGNARLSDDLEASRKEVAELTGKLKESDLRYQAEAEKYRRVKFWIIVGFAAWVGLQFLSGVARFYPPLQPFARFAGAVVAPAVQASYERVTKAVGKAINDAEKISKDSAEVIRTYLDPHADAADQELIKAKYLKEP